MNKRIQTLTLSLLALLPILSLASCSFNEKDLSGTGTTTEAENAISLKVVNLARVPVMGARVTLCEGAVACATPLRVTQTDAEGAARLDSLADGEYYLAISQDTLLEGIAVTVNGGGEHDMGTFTLDGIAEPTVIGNLFVGNWLYTWSDEANVEQWSMALGDRGVWRSCRWDYAVGTVNPDSSCARGTLEDLGNVTEVFPVLAPLVGGIPAGTDSNGIANAHVLLMPIDSMPEGYRWSDGWLFSRVGLDIIFLGDIQYYEGDADPLLETVFTSLDGTRTIQMHADSTGEIVANDVSYTGTWEVSEMGRITLACNSVGGDSYVIQGYPGIDDRRLLLLDFEDPARFVAR